MKDAVLAFLDVETTGLDPQRHEVIQIGVVLAKQIEREGNVGPAIEKNR
jgi:DNA polymerase III epsilon subunit-like protein